MCFFLGFCNGVFVVAADVTDADLVHIERDAKGKLVPSWGRMRWPIYVLFGNRNIFVLTLFLYERYVNLLLISSEGLMVRSFGDMTS